MKNPPHYSSMVLDTDPNFRKCLRWINTYSGGKTFGSCSGHPENTYEKTKDKLFPLLNVRFPKKDGLDNINALASIFVSKGFLRAYIVDEEHRFLAKKFPGSIGLTLHLKYEVKDNWDKVLAVLEEIVAD